MRAMLDRMLTSQVFAKSRRMSRLLRFVVEEAIAGTAWNLNEYVIGLEVFDRNAAAYNPGDDPIVRVQIGRLRKKLQEYYVTGGDESDIRFDIPLGSYVPIFRRVSVDVDQPQNAKILVLSIKGIAINELGAHFAKGLREELLHQLFHTLGSIMVLPASGDGIPMDHSNLTEVLSAKAVDYVLEGSARFEAVRVRVSLRLITALGSSLVWSGQFDREVTSAINAQEALAKEICSELEKHITDSNNE